MQDLDYDNLPEDVETLQQLIISQATELRSLQEQLNLSLHRRFGKTSEKHPGQHELFDEPEDIIEQADEEVESSEDDTDVVEVSPHQRKTRGRKPLPADLPRVEVIHDLDEAEKVCDIDGHELHKIGEDISEQLEIIPAQIHVIRNIRIKYACRACETGIKTAPLPAQLIPKSSVSG